MLALAAALPGEPLAGILAMDIETGLEILLAIDARNRMAERSANRGSAVRQLGKGTHVETVTGGLELLRPYSR